MHQPETPCPVPPPQPSAKAAQAAPTPPSFATEAGLSQAPADAKVEKAPLPPNQPETDGKRIAELFASCLVMLEKLALVPDFDDAGPSQGHAKHGTVNRETMKALLQLPGLVSEEKGC